MCCELWNDKFVLQVVECEVCAAKLWNEKFVLQNVK